MPNGSGSPTITVWTYLFVWISPSFLGGKPTRKGNSTRYPSLPSVSPSVSPANFVMGLHGPLRGAALRGVALGGVGGVARHCAGRGGAARHCAGGGGAAWHCAGRRGVQLGGVARREAGTGSVFVLLMLLIFPARLEFVSRMRLRTCGAAGDHAFHPYQRVEVRFVPVLSSLPGGKLSVAGGKRNASDRRCLWGSGRAGPRPLSGAVNRHCSRKGNSVRYPARGPMSGIGVPALCRLYLSAGGGHHGN
jgi:hypothetical protein